MDNDKVYRECGPGWNSLIDPIVAKATELGATITTIKEKYGQLRVYFHSGDEDCDALEDMIDAAEVDSASTCEMCGKPGHRMQRAHWLKTLCAEHALYRGYREYA